jgi:hypothetical protein
MTRPMTRGDYACMSACYLLTALLFVMVCAPHKVGAFVIGLLP